MSDHFLFYHTDWLLITVIGACLLWFVFIWKEWKQSRKRFFLKITVAFIAILNLALLVLQPLVNTTVETGLGVLVTKGYKQSQLDSLLDMHNDLYVINYQPNKLFAKKLDTISNLLVLGNGLKSYDFWQVDSVSVKYIGGSLPEGIIQVNYPTKNTISNVFNLKGKYSRPKLGNRIFLEDPGGNLLDSTKLNSSQEQIFELSTKLKVSGKFVYSLVEKDSLGNIVSHDPIPIKVEERAQLKILIVNGFPTFETKYLKNFLAESQHQVFVRNQLTKGKFTFEYYNTSANSRALMNENFLKTLDLLIIDAQSFTNLSSQKRSEIKNMIREDGLGLYIQPSDYFFKTNKELSSFTTINDKTTNIQLDEWPTRSLVKYPFYFEKNYKIEPIHKSNNKQITVYEQLGRGRIGASSIENTYSLFLEGHTSMYQKYWTDIISKISKKRIPLVTWESKEKFAFKDHPFNLKIRTILENPVLKKDSQNNIALRGDIDLTNVWRGNTYPQELGWNKIYLQQDTTQVYEYFVTDSIHYKPLTAYNTILENKRYFDRNLEKTELKTIQKPINKLWFFTVFLLSIGFLWLEPKL